MVSYMRRSLAPTIVFAIALLLAPLAVHATPEAGDDTGRCGVTLVLRNPDLQEDSNGVIHAAGWFFIQFQAVGEGAENVEYFTFSFGKPAPGDYSNCDTPEWLTGAYLKNYRGDYDPSDGFFVPINTTLVPDDTYGAAVHAYDSSDREIGRFWVTAEVDNCEGGQGTRCGDDPAQVVDHDAVIPWPIILPGDGVQTNDVQGVTIEFAEGLTSLEAWISGEAIELDPWEGRQFDDDVVPGNDGNGGPTDATCTGPGDGTPFCTKRSWGPAFKWEGPIDENDVIKVRAVDEAGNVAEKIVHLLDPNAGGILAGDVVDVDMQVDESVKETTKGKRQSFQFTFTNLGNTEAHTNLFAEGPDVATYKWEPPHVVVPAGESASAELRVEPNPSLENGDVEVTARAEYQSGSDVVSKQTTVTLRVGEGGEIGNATAGNATDDGAAQETGGGIPAPGAVVAAGALALGALAVAQRRRRDA